MKFHSGLTANMALMLALWSVAITASPIMSVVDRLANHEAPGAPVVAAFMRELELERTNQQAWEAQYKKELNTYKTDGAYLEGTELATADKAVKDGLICIKHEDLTDYLTNTLGATWAKADAALTAKESLLAQIRNLLANADNEAMGLHCGDNKSEGAGKLCGILTQLEGEAAEERRLLEADQGVIEDHKSAVNDYMCDCTYSIWTTYPECDGDDVETVTTYTGCDVHDEDSCTLNENAKCGSGTTSITRTFKWGPKVGQDGDGKACDPTGEVDVDGDAGTLSEVNSDKEQTFTKDCMAGDYNGDCPVDCEWNDWEVELKDVVCKDDDELLVQCTDGDGNLAEGERFRTRTKKSTQAAGGKPCFYNEKLEEDGQKETEVCHYHDNADIDMKGEKAALAEKDETILALKTKMCEGDRGPCQNKGECEVTIKDNEVATWCNCPSTHTGTWCQDSDDSGDDSAGSARCFDPSTRVELVDGNMIPVEKLHVGDKIASCSYADQGSCGNKTFDKVTIVSVIEKGGPFSAHTFVLENNMQINVTSPHLMYTYQRDDGKLVPVTTAAKDVRVDDVMMLQGGSFAKVIQVVDFQLSRKVQIITAGGSFLANGVLTTGMCENYNAEDTLNLPASKVLKSYVDGHKDFFNCILAENEIREPSAAVISDCRLLMA